MSSRIPHGTRQPFERAGAWACCRPPLFLLPPPSYQTRSACTRYLWSFGGVSFVRPRPPPSSPYRFQRNIHKAVASTGLTEQELLDPWAQPGDSCVDHFFCPLSPAPPYTPCYASALVQIASADDAMAFYVPNLSSRLPQATAFGSSAAWNDRGSDR